MQCANLDPSAPGDRRACRPFQMPAVHVLRATATKGDEQKGAVYAMHTSRRRRRPGEANHSQKAKKGTSQATRRRMCVRRSRVGRRAWGRVYRVGGRADGRGERREPESLRLLLDGLDDRRRRGRLLRGTAKSHAVFGQLHGGQSDDDHVGQGTWKVNRW